jgi:hypothetical protein
LFRIIFHVSAHSIKSSANGQTLPFSHRLLRAGLQSRLPVRKGQSRFFVGASRFLKRNQRVRGLGQFYAPDVDFLVIEHAQAELAGDLDVLHLAVEKAT